MFCAALLVPFLLAFFSDELTTMVLAVQCDGDGIAIWAEPVLRCLVAAPLAQLFAAAGETVESGRSPHGEGQRPVPLERCWVLLRC